MLRRLIFVIALLGLLAGAGAYIALWSSAGPKAGPHTIVVEEGASLAKVANQLVAAGAVPGTAPAATSWSATLARLDPSSTTIVCGPALGPALDHSAM